MLKKNKTVNTISSQKKSIFAKIFRKSNKNNIVVESYFQKLTKHEIQENIATISSHPYFNSAVYLTSKGQLKNTYSYRTPNLDVFTGGSWLLGLIKFHNGTLNNFLHLESEISKSILTDRHDVTISLLDDCDKQCGISTWSMSVRGSLLKLSEKHKESQHFLNTLLATSGKNDFLKAICRNMMNRYDDSAMFQSTTQSIRKQILRNMPLDLQNFLMYKIVACDYSHDFKIDFEHIFNFEKDSSIIDVFKAVINFLVNLIGVDDVELIDLGKEIVEELQVTLSYPVLNGLSAYFGVNSELRCIETDYSYIDLYTAGLYNKVCERAESKSNEYFDFSTFELIAKSAARINAEPFGGIKGYILSNLVNIFNKNNGYQKSLSNLLAICHAFSGISWFKELHLLISRESSYIDNNSNSMLMTLSSVFSEVNYPRKALILNKEFRSKYLESCEEIAKESLAVKLFKAIDSGEYALFEEKFSSRLEKNRLLKYHAKLLINNGFIREAIKLLERLRKCGDPIIVYETVRLLADCYINVDEPCKAIELFVNTALDNSNLVALFDTHSMCRVSEKLIKKKNSSICLPISLSLHSRLVDSKYDSTLRFSFDIFLESAGLESPLSLIDNIDAYGPSKVHYFLEHVCTQDVMKLSFFFNNEIEIEQCRIAICTYLIENNISKNQLISHVKEITKEQVIRKAGHQVDQSRIYAELEVFNENQSQAFKDVFERYLEYNKSDFISFEDEKILSSIYEKIDKDILLKEAYTVHVLDLSMNEKNATFHKLISMLRDEFTFGEKGLNYYLSTRIRHGVLLSKIRSSVSEYHLVTAIQESTGYPKKNEYWRSQLLLLPEVEWNQVEKALSKFTVDFLSTIKLINDEWLQIYSLDQDIKNLQKGGSKTKALFNYSLSTLETYFLQQLLSDDDFSSFSRLISKWFWTRTEENLLKVKKAIATEAKNKFSKCYEDLYRSVSAAVLDGSSKTALQNAINRSKESLYANLITVSSWFTRSEISMIKSFEFDTAIEIASRAANIPVCIDSRLRNIQFKGKYLNSFVDILYILFENAVSKSQLEKEDLEVTVVLDLVDDKCVKIEITNNCKTFDDVDSENRGLDYYRNLYGKDQMLSKIIQKEGGTGILKICNIISKDIEVRHTSDFFFSSNNTFTFSLIIQDVDGVLSYENTYC